MGSQFLYWIDDGLSGCRRLLLEDFHGFIPGGPHYGFAVYGYGYE